MDRLLEKMVIEECNFPKCLEIDTKETGHKIFPFLFFFFPGEGLLSHWQLNDTAEDRQF